MNVLHWYFHFVAVDRANAACKNDRPNRATAAEAPLGEAQERYHFDNPTTYTRVAYQHGEAA